MDFVVPLLNEGLVYLLIKVYTYKSKVEVAHILPDDPVEFLSEYLYKKSFEVDKE
jgi:adenylate kinase